MEENNIIVKSEGSKGSSEVLCVVGDECEPLGPQSKRFKVGCDIAPSNLLKLPCKEVVTVPHSEDEYEHVQSGLVYVISSFPGVSVPHTLSSDYIQGCKCDEICSETCLCFLQHGFPYEKEMLKQSYFEKPVFECNDWCNCNDDCPNRVIQQGPVIGLEVLLLPEKGHGVLSSSFIPRSSFVCEYAGEYISVEEARLRFSRQSDNDSNYILVLKEHFQETTSGPCITIIDPTVVGNIGRYINHSCDPNLVVVPVRINSMLPLAAFFAVRDILPGEELCYDYSSTVSLKERKLSMATREKGAAGSQDKEIGQKFISGMDNASCLKDNEILLSKSFEEHGDQVSAASYNNKRYLETNAASSSHPRKLCHCKSKECRKFLPADRDIF